MEETWKDIVGYEGHYAISNFGRVKNVKLKCQKSFRGQYICVWACQSGYLYATLYKNNKKQNMLISRMVGIAFLGKPPIKHEINHKDGNKTNNRIDNLEWVNHKENMRHARLVLKRKLNIKLTRDKVVKIKQMLDDRILLQSEIAGKMNVSQTTISSIKCGRTWGELCP